MLAPFGPLAFNIRTPRCEVSVLRFQGHRRAKSAGKICALRAQDIYAPSYLSGWSPALPRATISFSEDSPKGLRRVSKPTSRSSDLCVLLTYWFKPLYERRVQSIATRFGADRRAEIRLIGTITWRALPSSPNPSGHST
jgi:hypothetical protein